MNPLASCKVAIAALKVNALRSFLAMLGVIIGVASVIVMVSVATGAGQAIEERIRALGTNLLIVSPGSFTSGGRRAGEGTAIALADAGPPSFPRGLVARISLDGAAWSDAEPLSPRPSGLVWTDEGLYGASLRERIFAFSVPRTARFVEITAAPRIASSMSSTGK